MINISEGRDRTIIDAVAAAAGDDLLDVHSDPFHHRSVLTVVGEKAARAVATEAVARIDLRSHLGAHPRIGALDVVPFVALEGSTFDDALRARDQFCRWASDELRLPCFAYGPERSLPAIRRGAFEDLEPTTGPGEPHPSAGAVAVGARELMVAYNVWLRDPDLDQARSVASAIRGPRLRALGLEVGDRVQVSMNLIAPLRLGPAEATDAVAAHAAIAGCELVGLVPEVVLGAVPTGRWEALDLSTDRTIEARLRRRLGAD